MSDSKASLASITVTLLDDGTVSLRSTCAGQFDSSYAPMPDIRLGAEVVQLVAELRERLAGVKSV